MNDVVAFYDAHPINQEQILHTLQDRGIALDTLTEEILKDHDQDHFGGIEANDILDRQGRHRARSMSCSTSAAGWAARRAISRIASAAAWSASISPRAGIAALNI